MSDAAATPLGGLIPLLLEVLQLPLFGLKDVRQCLGTRSITIVDSDTGKRGAHPAPPFPLNLLLLLLFTTIEEIW